MIDYLIFDKKILIKKELYFDNCEFSNFDRFFKNFLEFIWNLF